MTEELIEMIDFSGDDEKVVSVPVSEFFKGAQVEFTYDWGNGHAIIISFEKMITDEEEKRITETVKRKLLQ